MEVSFGAAALLWVMTFAYAMVDSGLALIHHCKLSTLDALIGGPNRAAFCAGQQAGTTAEKAPAAAANPPLLTRLQFGTGRGPVRPLATVTSIAGTAQEVASL